MQILTLLLSTEKKKPCMAFIILFLFEYPVCFQINSPIGVFFTFVICLYISLKKTWDIFNIRETLPSVSFLGCGTQLLCSKEGKALSVSSQMRHSNDSQMIRQLSHTLQALLFIYQLNKLFVLSVVTWEAYQINMLSSVKYVFTANSPV